ncbi:MAG TPA: type I methionyl aminopeptidase, partial [Candidatus Paceibacterota bacterium]|nr:type I methionyl aminopeptidase [Candidatus Paceibacterota bacterium]
MTTLKNEKEILLMTEAGKRLGAVLATLKKAVRPGITTKELDALAYQLITAPGDTPAFLGYQPDGAAVPYPATLCASVNDGVVHGLPGGRQLAEGDIVKLDLGLIHKGYYVDAAVTVPVGKISARTRKLVAVTEEALARAVKAARPGRTLGDIGHAVQEFVEANGFSVVRALTGHGIGKDLHEDPAVYNFGTPGTGERLRPGMTLALEPMVNAGRP